MGGIWVGGKYINMSSYVTTYCISFSSMTSYYVNKQALWSLDNKPVMGPMLPAALVILAFWSE